VLKQEKLQLVAKKSYTHNHEEENRVLQARYVSLYKGKPVIRIAGLGGRSFSLYGLFISPELEPGDRKAIDTVKHEYGHAVQLEQLGIIRYLRHIALPSMSSTVQGASYYEQPWEITADLLGGVDRGHSDAALNAGKDYLASAKRKSTDIFGTDVSGSTGT